jgi:hypothetical protein
MGLKISKVRLLVTTLILITILSLTLLTACGEEPKAPAPTNPPPSPTMIAGNQNNLIGGSVAAATAAPNTATPIVITQAALTPTPTPLAVSQTTPTPSGGIALLTPLPTKAGYKALNVGGMVEQELKSSLLGSSTSFGNAQYLITRDSFASIEKYYNSQLSKTYRRIGSQSLKSLGGQFGNLTIPNGLVVGYHKLATASTDAPANLALVNVGPVTQNFLNQLRTVAPDVAAQLTPGDRLIIMLYDVPQGLG